MLGNETSYSEKALAAHCSRSTSFIFLHDFGLPSYAAGPQFRESLTQTGYLCSRGTSADQMFETDVNVTVALSYGLDECPPRRFFVDSKIKPRFVAGPVLPGMDGPAPENAHREVSELVHPEPRNRRPRITSAIFIGSQRRTLVQLLPDRKRIYPGHVPDDPPLTIVIESLLDNPRRASADG